MLLIGISVFIASVAAATSSVANNTKKISFPTSSPPMIFVTPHNNIGDVTVTSAKQKIVKKKTGLDKKIRDKAANEKKATVQSFGFFPNDRFESFGVQANPEPKESVRQSARLPPQPVLSSTKDFTLTDLEEDEERPSPASYETIVYNPNNIKDASTAFSRSNFWETPELTIRDTVQREESKNSFTTSASRQEYTPNYKSAQPPLNNIHYRGRETIRTSPAPFRRPTHAPSVQLQNKQEEVEDESEGVDDNEDLSEDEEDEEGESSGNKYSYPVTLEEQNSFDPYQGIDAPEDIYSDVLNNIGSVFAEDHDPQLGSPQSFTKEDEDSNANLGQGFDRHSYENLQRDEDNEEITEDDGDYTEENEDISEYADEEEGDETKQVPKTKITPTTTPTPFYGRHSYKPRTERPQDGGALKNSPFPSVKIIADPSKPAETTRNQQNHWSPTQVPIVQQTPWSKSQAWQQSVDHTQKLSPLSKSWGKAELPQKELNKNPLNVLHKGNSKISDKEEFPRKWNNERPGKYSSHRQENQPLPKNLRNDGKPLLKNPLASQKTSISSPHEEVKPYHDSSTTKHSYSYGDYEPKPKQNSNHRREKDWPLSKNHKKKFASQSNSGSSPQKESKPYEDASSSKYSYRYGDDESSPKKQNYRNKEVKPYHESSSTKQSYRYGDDEGNKKDHDDTSIKQAVVSQSSSSSTPRKDGKPYKESYNKSFQKSWKTDSKPIRNQYSESKTWEEGSPTESKNSYKTRDGQPSKKVPRESPPETLPRVIPVVEVEENQQTKETVQKDSIAIPSSQTEKESAPVVIDKLYENQNSQL